MPIASGRCLGPYELVAPLGSGRMGEVYRARDRRLGRDVAVKVIPADDSRDPERLRRFEQEARAVAGLNHSNVLALYDVGSDDGLSYVVFELLEGQTLAQRLERGPLPVLTAVAHALEICRGLDAAHGRGIVHRDLKPSNVFVTVGGQVKILDFGLAKLRDGADTGAVPADATLTEPGLLLGTIGYMSPEQARGRPADPRSDIFSLGAIVYEMVCGRRAFEEGTPADTLAAILGRDPPEMSRAAKPVPALLEQVVRRALAKDPDERFQSARELAFVLEAVKAAHPPPARGPAPAHPGRSLRIAAILVILLGLAAGTFQWGGRTSVDTPLPEFKRLTFRRGMVLGARFTADGNTIVYNGLWDGAAPENFSTRIEGRQSVSLQLPPAHLWGVSRRGELALVLAPPGEKRYSWRGTLARVPLSGGVPREVAEDVWMADWSPDGNDLAAVRLVAGALQIEYPLGHVIARPVTDMADGGQAFRVSPRGDRIAYVTYDSLAVIDRDGKPVPLPKDVPLASGLAWDPSGDAIWVAGKAGMRTSIGLWRIGFDGSVREVTRLPGEGMLHDVSSDGRMLFHHGVELDGARARAPGEAAEHDVPVFNWDGTARITDDGEQLLFVDLSDPPERWSLLRPTRGGPAIRLGQGRPIAFSPDGKRVVVDQGTDRPKLVLIPTGPGNARVLPVPTLDAGAVGWGWFPSETHVLLNCRTGTGKDWQTFQLDLTSETLSAVTPEGSIGVKGSGDDGFVLAFAPDRSMAWHPLRGGAKRDVTARLPDGIIFTTMSTDREWIYIGETGVPGKLDRLHLPTGRRVAWKTLQPDDPAGFTGVIGFAVTPTGSAYAYRYLRFLQDLYLVEGVS